MKIIDLLNKIANGEEVPEKIRYEGRDMFWCEPCTIYEAAEVKEGELCGTDLYNILDNLNDEVEVIEEDKKIEKLEQWLDVKSWVEGAGLEKGLEEQNEFNKNIYYKINEIIDKLNEEE